MARISLALLLLTVLATIARASAPSFCKCTCFQNSTIIPLGPQHDTQPAPAPPPPPPAAAKPPSSSSSTSTSTNSPSSTTTTSSRRDDRQNVTLNPLSHLLNLIPREASTSCKQCNRAFCLKYNLPICKDAEDKDIKTTCFQRDSRKDQVIVWGFLLGTAGLLGWAALRRVVESAKEKGRGRRLGVQGQEITGGGGEGGRGGRGRFGFGSFGGLSGGRGRAGEGVGREGNHERVRGLYDPLEDGDDGGAARGSG